MTGTRKRHSPDFKSKVAIDAIRQQQTVNELTAKYAVHATQINQWRKQALAAIPAVFKGKAEREQQDRQAEIDELHRQLGQVIAERDWLKKKSLRLR